MTASTGTCTVKYDQAGDSNYNAAPQVMEDGRQRRDFVHVSDVARANALASAPIRAL